MAALESPATASLAGKPPLSGTLPPRSRLGPSKPREPCTPPHVPLLRALWPYLVVVGNLVKGGPGTAVWTQGVGWATFSWALPASSRMLPLVLLNARPTGHHVIHVLPSERANEPTGSSHGMAIVTKADCFIVLLVLSTTSRRTGLKNYQYHVEAYLNPMVS